MKIYILVFIVIKLMKKNIKIKIMILLKIIILKISDCSNDDFISNSQIDSFLNNCLTDNIIIGGCCGYGVNEMNELINLIKFTSS